MRVLSSRGKGKPLPSHSVISRGVAPGCTPSPPPLRTRPREPNFGAVRSAALPSCSVPHWDLRCTSFPLCTPRSRRAHAELTPRSRRDHAEITPRSRRDHAELTLSFRPFGEVDLPYPGYERRALSQHFPHYRYGVRVVGVELLCNLAELSAALQARDRRSTYDLGEVHIGRRALLCSGRTDCPASSPPLSARMRSTTASRRTPRWSMSTTRHGTLRGSRASPRGSPIS